MMLANTNRGELKYDHMRKHVGETMKEYKPEKLITISRYRNYISNLSEDIKREMDGSAAIAYR